MRLRLESWPALATIAAVGISGIVACGDDDGAGGAAGTTGASTSAGTSSASGSTKSATSSASASSTDAATSSAMTSADASSNVSASTTATGQNLELCGVDDPGGEVASCDPATEYCQEMNGGIVASQQFDCHPKPPTCAGAPTCDCVEVDGCKCTMEGQLVRITCNFP